MPSGTNLGGGQDFAALLADLVGVAAEIARMDEMLAQPEATRSLEPPESETAGVGSLRADLERLRGYSKEKCLLVRKIKRLGLESPQKLKAHFERYGAVSEVLVAHSFEKPSAKRRSGRMRPAAIGFIVMAADAAAASILATGESHMVRDGADFCEVSVQPYNPQAAASGLELEA